MPKKTAGKNFEIRPLTRGELKGLRKKGYNLANLSPESAEDAIDEIFVLVFDERMEEIDALPYAQALELFTSIIDATYGGAAEKNS